MFLRVNLLSVNFQDLPYQKFNFLSLPLTPLTSAFCFQTLILSLTLLCKPPVLTKYTCSFNLEQLLHLNQVGVSGLASQALRSDARQNTVKSKSCSIQPKLVQSILWSFVWKRLVLASEHQTWKCQCNWKCDHLLRNHVCLFFCLVTSLSGCSCFQSYLLA